MYTKLHKPSPLKRVSVLIVYKVVLKILNAKYDARELFSSDIHLVFITFWQNLTQENVLQRFSIHKYVSRELLSFKLI